MEWWSGGVRSDGVMEPLLHHSAAPSLRFTLSKSASLLIYRYGKQTYSSPSARQLRDFRFVAWTGLYGDVFRLWPNG